MNKKTGFLLVAVLLFTLIGSSCTSDDTANKSAGGLKIYYLDADRNISSALDIFGSKFKDTKIDAKMFSSAQMEEYKNQFTVSMLSGDGPDIISVNPLITSSIRKLMQNGVFCDLNKLIEEDHEFSLSDYNEKAMEAGVYKEKRYLLTVMYRLDTFASSKGMLDQCNVSLGGSDWTWKQLAGQVEKFSGKNADMPKYFFDERFKMSKVIENSGDYFVDFNNKTARFDSKEFIALLNIYKDIYPAICTPEDAARYNTVQIKDFVGSGLILTSSFFSLGSPGSLYDVNSTYKNERNEDVNITPFPLLEGQKGIVSLPFQLVGINNKCKDKKSAFEFLKILLSEELQRNVDSSGNPVKSLSFVPVNKKAYEKDLEFYSDAGVNTYYENGTAIPGELGEYMDSIINSVDKCIIFDNNISLMIDEEAAGFLKGEKTAEQAAGDLQRKVTLYLNE